MATILVATIVLAGIFAIMPVQTVSAARGGNSPWVNTGTPCTNDDGDASTEWLNTVNGKIVCR